MFDRYTASARQVIVLAQDEARAFRHPQITSEHLLIGLLRESQGVAAHILESFGLSVEQVRSWIDLTVGQGDGATTGQIPFSADAHLVMREGLTAVTSVIGSRYIDTEHLLLGLLSINDSPASQLLRALDLNPARIRSELLRTIIGRSQQSAEPEPPNAYKEALALLIAAFEAGPVAGKSFAITADELTAARLALAS